MQLKRIGILLWAGLLWAGCTQDEEMMAPTTIATEPVPISFNCWTTDNEAETRAANGTTGPITTQNYQLRHTGFGVFSATETGISPDMMYNQRVTFTILADDADNGYWSYYPQKYWPNDQDVIDNLYFCGYAPYVECPAEDFKDDPSNTGIIGMSANNDNSAPFILYARAKDLDETVDLLWSYMKPTAKPTTGGAVAMKMYHALARVAVGLKLSSAAADDTKVLIRRITLIPTKMAKRGKLDLTSHGTYTVNENEVVIPTWTVGDDDWTTTTAERTIVTDHDPEQYHIDNPSDESYGSIDNTIRMIPNMPYNWQPAGLNATEYQNALSSDGHQAFLYFIPQSAFSVTCKVAYTIMKNNGTTTTGVKETSSAVQVSGDGTLRGNITYHLNLSLDL